MPPRTRAPVNSLRGAWPPGADSGQGGKAAHAQRDDSCSRVEGWLAARRPWGGWGWPAGLARVSCHFPLLKIYRWLKVGRVGSGPLGVGSSWGNKLRRGTRSHLACLCRRQTTPASHATYGVYYLHDKENLVLQTAESKGIPFPGLDPGLAGDLQLGENTRALPNQHLRVHFSGRWGERHAVVAGAKVP